MLELQAADGTPLTPFSLTAERGVDSAVVAIRVANTGATKVAGAFLSLLVQAAGPPPYWTTTGHPAADEQWGRLQITAVSGTGAWDGLILSAQSMGHLAVACLPAIEAGGYVSANFWLKQPATSAGGSAVSLRLVVAGDEPARGVALGVAEAAWGVCPGVNTARSFVISGGLVTASGSPDDQVHVAAREWLLAGLEYSDGVEDVTLNQNDGAASALAAGQSYYAAISQSVSGAPTVTKGLKSSGTPTRPAFPLGELLLAYVQVHYGGGGSVIASGDIEASPPTYGRLLAIAPASGLTLDLYAGESLAGGFLQLHAAKETLVLVASETNRVWMKPTGALAVTQTAAAPAPASILLWVAVTDGSNVTALTDYRPFIGYVSKLPIRIVSSDYAVTAFDGTILADTSGGNVTVTLQAAPVDGRLLMVKNVNGGTNTLTIARNGNTIDGTASDITTATNNDTYVLQYLAAFGWAIV